MSKKRIPTLSDIVSGENTQPEAEPTVMKETRADEPIQKSWQMPVQRKTVVPPKKITAEDKKGRASTTVYLPQEVKRQLEEIWFAERQGKSQNDLFLEGLDLVFKQRGLPSMKELVKEEA